jgi:hypothetical protein
MDKEIIDKVIEDINTWISLAAREYKVKGSTELYKRTVDRIIGMIRVLSIITNKEWSFDEKGLKEV